MDTSGLLLWVVGALAGSMVFFGAIVAPLVFRSLPADEAGRFLRAFFPKYYVWGMAVSLIGVVIAAFADVANLVLCVLVTLLFVFARQWLMPRINDARDASLTGDTAATARFDHLHKLSVVINMLQLLILLGISARLIW